MGNKIQRIYIGTNLVRPVYKREPGANTLAYYPLAEDCNDYSGNNRHGTNSNVTFSNGLATFNGTNAMVTIPHADWNRIQTNMTIQAWYRYTGAADGYGVVVSKTQMNPYYNSNMYYFISSADGGTKVAGGFAGKSTWNFYPVGQWNPTGSYEIGARHLLTLTKDGTTLTLYCDGEMVSTTTYTTTTSTSSIPLIIGNWYRYNVDGRFTGNISNVILEDKTWAAAEILEYYKGMKVKYS